MSIKDQVAALPLKRSAERAFAVLDATQKWEGAEQMLGTGTAFLVWCRRFDLDPREVLANCARRVRDGQAQNNVHILAMRGYMRDDVKAAATPFTF